MFEKCSKKCGNSFYFIFRIMIGFLFLQHGGQKLFGWFGGLGGSAVPLFSKMGLAGSIEFIGGLLIILGLFTKIAAVIAGLEMIYAYITFHLPQGLNPFAFPPGNGGELALVYIAAFLVLSIQGARKWSLEKAIFKKEF